MTKAVIDADPIVHIVANVQWSVGNEDEESMVRDHVRNFVSTVLTGCECDEYIMFVQDVGHQNFRNLMLMDYKGHRKPNPATTRWKPVIIDELKKLGAVGLEFIESDDALALLGRHYKYQPLIVANDKDLVQIQGRHYNPYKKDKPGSPVERWFSSSQYDAQYSLCKQLITGDTTDMPGEYCGIQKVGPKTAEKWLEKTKQEDWLPMISAAYMAKYGISQGLKRMALTFDMVKLISHPDQVRDEFSQGAWLEANKVLPFIKYESNKDTFESAKGSENQDLLFDN
jgi:5'-3' exonuclease